MLLQPRPQAFTLELTNVEISLLLDGLLQAQFLLDTVDEADKRLEFVSELRAQQHALTRKLEKTITCEPFDVIPHDESSQTLSSQPALDVRLSFSELGLVVSALHQTAASLAQVDEKMPTRELFADLRALLVQLALRLENTLGRVRHRAGPIGN